MKTQWYILFSLPSVPIRTSILWFNTRPYIFQTNKDIASISRADLSQVIAGALLNPNACNLVLYMTKSQERGVADGDIWQKFARLKTERGERELPFQ